MKVTTAFAVIGTAFFVAWTRYRLQQWERTIVEWEDELLHARPLELGESKQTWEELPDVVQRYLSEALGPSPEKETGVIRLLRFSQSGTFQTTPNHPWTKFSAEQLITTNPPGFIWDGSVAMFPYLENWPSFQVCDAWTKGKASLKVALMNVFEISTTPRLLDDKVKQHQMEQELQMGEAVRWLAEALLVPTSLMPSQGFVTWTTEGSNVRSDQAVLKFVDSFGLPDAQLVVTFDKDSGLPTRIDGTRPKWHAAMNTFEMVAWQGYLEDFQKQQLDDLFVVVPGHMKVGWINPATGALELYFDGYNHDLQYIEWGTSTGSTKSGPKADPMVASMS